MFARCGRRMTSTGILRGWNPNSPNPIPAPGLTLPVRLTLTLTLTLPLTGILRGWEAWKEQWAHNQRITR